MTAMVRMGVGLSLMAVLYACASSSGAPREGVGSRGALTAADIDMTRHPDAHTLLRALRPEWLEVRGPTSVMGQSAVKAVYLDGRYLGGVTELRTIRTVTVQSIEHFDGPEATQRWGSGYAGGVIYILSRR